MLLNKNNIIIAGVLGLIIIGILVFVFVYRGDDEKKKDVPDFNFYAPSGTLGFDVKSGYTYERYTGYTGSTDIILTVTVNFNATSQTALQNGWVNKLKLTLEDVNDQQNTVLTSHVLESGIQTGTGIQFDLILASTTPNAGVQGQLDTDNTYNVYLYYNINDGTGSDSYIRFSTGLLSNPLNSSNDNWDATIKALNTYQDEQTLIDLISSFTLISFEAPDLINSSTVNLDDIPQQGVYIAFIDDNNRTEDIYINRDPRYIQIEGSSFELHPHFDNDSLTYCYLKRANIDSDYLNSVGTDFVNNGDTAGKFVLYNQQEVPVLPAPIKFDDNTDTLTLPSFFLVNDISDVQVDLSTTITENEITIGGVGYQIVVGYSFTYNSTDLKFIQYNTDEYVLVYPQGQRTNIFRSSAKELFFNGSSGRIKVLDDFEASIDSSDSPPDPTTPDPTTPASKTITINRLIDNTDGDFKVIVTNINNSSDVQQDFLNQEESFGVTLQSGVSYELTTGPNSHVKYLAVGSATILDDSSRNGPYTYNILDAIVDNENIYIKFGEYSSAPAPDPDPDPDPAPAEPKYEIVSDLDGWRVKIPSDGEWNRRSITRSSSDATRKTLSEWKTYINDSSYKICYDDEDEEEPINLRMIENCEGNYAFIRSFDAEAGPRMANSSSSKHDFKFVRV